MTVTGTDIALLKSRLHEYIEHADEQHLAAIYVLLEKEMPPLSNYDKVTLSGFYKRRDAHLKGETKSYTIEEAFAHIRAHHGK
jgi:hypothetical protein